MCYKISYQQLVLLIRVQPLYSSKLQMLFSFSFSSLIYRPEAKYFLRSSSVLLHLQVKYVFRIHHFQISVLYKKLYKNFGQKSCPKCLHVEVSQLKPFCGRGVKLVVTRGHISLAVAFKGPDVT